MKILTLDKHRRIIAVKSGDYIENDLQKGDVLIHNSFQLSDKKLLHAILDENNKLVLDDVYMSKHK